MKQTIKKSDTLNKWLRFLLPIPIGIIAYILILLLFDTLDQLGSHFFSEEVVVSIIFSFIVLELQRITLSVVDKKFPIDIHTTKENNNEDEPLIKGPNASSRIVIIPLLSLLLSIAIISILVVFYYTYCLGLKDYYRELIVFNGVFGIISVVYAIIHVSTSFLTVNKQIHYTREKELRKSLEHDLENYKLQINPQLLYDSLENLICIVRHDKKKAEAVINHLSAIYRYILDTRHVELIDLSEEIKSLHSLLYILNVKHNGALHIINSIDKIGQQMQLVPGTISTLILAICKRSIINQYKPLEIKLNRSNNRLLFCTNNTPRLTLNGNTSWNLDQLNRAYEFFGPGRPSIKINDTEINISIPLFEIEEE